MLFLLACIAASPQPARAPLPESDAPFAGTGTWTLGGHAVVLTGTVLASGDWRLDGVYDPPVAGDGVLWVPAETSHGEGGIWAVREVAGALTASVFVGGGRPDRLAAVPGGVAYVSGASGLASVWVALDGASPRPLTNVGIVPTPGRAPAGFVPPPPRGGLVVEGERLRWTADGPREIRWAR